MKYSAFIKELKNGEEFVLEENLIGTTIQILPSGNIKVAGLLPDFSGQII